MDLNEVKTADRGERVLLVDATTSQNDDEKVAKIDRLVSELNLVSCEDMCTVTERVVEIV